MAEDPRDVATPSSPPGDLELATNERDQLDPELIRLRRPAPQIGLITAAAIVVACITLMIRLRSDFAFARAGDSPQLVALSDLVTGKLVDDSYVTLSAPLERSAATRVRVTEANAGTRVVPVAGSNDRLWLAVPGDAWSPFQYDEIATGRLKPLASVRYGESIAAHVAAHPAPRFVTGDELRRARLATTEADASADLAVIGGGQVVVRSPDAIEFLLPDPNASVVVATFHPRLPTVAAWTSALAAAGVIAPDATPERTTADTARWKVARSNATVTQALESAGLWSARAESATAHIRTTWGQLAADENGVRSPSGLLPWSAVDVAAVWAPRAIPPDARVILVGESPGSYWYLPPVYAGLGMFALLFTWALAVAIRRHFFDSARGLPARP